MLASDRYAAALTVFRYVLQGPASPRSLRTPLSMHWLSPRLESRTVLERQPSYGALKLQLGLDTWIGLAFLFVHFSYLRNLSI